MRVAVCDVFSSYIWIFNMNYTGFIFVLVICVALVKCEFEEEHELKPGPPSNLTVGRVFNSSVNLTWLQPKHPNGEVRGYRIYYMQGNKTSVRSLRGNQYRMSFTLSDLQPNTNFKIWTKAFTAKHEGESSQPVNVTTDLSSPGPPIISNLTCQDEFTIFIEWLRPSLVFGSVDLYYIFYRPENYFSFEEIAINSVNNRMENNFLISNLSSNTMYEIKVCGGTYSKYYSENNITYRGPFSRPQKIQLFKDCHKQPIYESRPPFLELSAGIIAGTIVVLLAIFLLVMAIILWRHYFKKAYYYLDDPPKMTPTLPNFWENDASTDGAFGPVDVHEFAKHTANLHADGDIGFSKEYESIASATDIYAAEISQHPDNKQKNRYLNIVAYDHSRVPLRPVPGQKRAAPEYVNANYIDGYDKARAYIGTQGPLPSTFETFWRMIWEQRVHIIVMITNLVERGRKKCDQYWPKEGIEMYGLIQVRLIHEEVLATYTIRKFSIRHMKVKNKKSGNAERLVYQYHYTNWPDHGTPDHPLPVLSFVRKSAAANPEDAGPIIVHCSAGVGRTGTYIVLDAMLQQIRVKGCLNIWGFLRLIRSQRNFLVQTEEQYIFIHDALLEAIQSGDTCIPRSALSRYIQKLQSTGGEKSTQWFLLSHQFKLVTNFQPRDFNVVSAMKQVNRVKNRSLDHIPMENARVHLTPKPGVDGSDYINGTWLMGHQKLREFILTQHPLPSTIQDFWQMVWDHNCQTIVVLTSVDEEKNFPQFWPVQNEDIDSENWKVKFIDEKMNSGLVSMEIAVQSLQDDYELHVKVIHAPGWPDQLPALTNTFSLVGVVQEMVSTAQCTNGPLVVVDKYGGTEAAMFCCMSALKCQVEFENMVDPYMYFKMYHNRRPTAWTSQDDLLYVYKALETYLGCDSSQSNGSTDDLIGFTDPVISPPFTTLPAMTAALLPPIAPCPPSIISPTQVIQPMQLDLTATTHNSGVLMTVSPQVNPSNGCANVNGQLTQPINGQAGTPINGFATLAGNGNVRQLSDGSEEVPQIQDIPPPPV